MEPSDSKFSLRRKANTGFELPTIGKQEYTNVPDIDDHEEKPWHLVIYRITRKSKHLRENAKSVKSEYILLVLLWYMLLAYLVQLIEDSMPRVINDYDLSKRESSIFSETSALRYLDDILGDGPRVAGTRYHLEKTEDLKSLVDGIAADADTSVHTDWQIASGSYSLDRDTAVVNKYHNVSNIIAVLEGESGFHENGTLKSAILINCHYDSVPFAMGASDNGIFCAVMAETLNRFSKRTKKFKHSIVFLFNGAEENPLQGSHAFLQHRWAQGVTAVINLDSAGMNGKPTLFQVSDARLLRAFRRAVPRPSAQGIAETLFRSGLVPSDTDFRVFRDFGDIHGIDIAFVKWGAVYHTRYDHKALIQPGVVQNAGDMVLNILTQLADMDEMAEKVPATTGVYYDYVNWFMISYETSTAVVVDVIIIIISWLSIGYFIWIVGPRWSSWRELAWSVLGRLASALAGAVLVTVFTALMVATSTQLRYLSRPWLVVPFYWLPFVIAAIATSHAFDSWRNNKHPLPRVLRCAQAACASRLTFSVLALACVFVPSLRGTTYVLSVPLGIASVMAIISMAVDRYLKLDAWRSLLLSLALSSPALLFSLCIALRFSAFALPIMGRSPSLPADAAVAACSVLFAVLCTWCVSGLELLFSSRRLWRPLLLLSIPCIILMFVPFWPYSDTGPVTMRHYWFHFQTTQYDVSHSQTRQQAGVFALKTDANNVRVLNGAHIECAGAGLYCGVPVFRTSMVRQIPESVLLPSGPPAIFSPPAAVSAAYSCVGTQCVYEFTVRGPPHCTLSLSPRERVSLSQWSLPVPLAPSLSLRLRPVYLIVESRATFSEQEHVWGFNVTAVVPRDLQPTTQPKIDVTFHAHKIYHPEDFTDEYRRIVAAAPAYFNIQSFISFRNDYVL